MRSKVLRTAALVAALTACPCAQDPARLRADAEAAQQSGELQRAAELWLALDKAEPGDERWLLAAASCLREAGLLERALDVLEPALTRFPESADLPAAIATAYLLHTEQARSASVNTVLQIQEARRVAEAALARHPGRRDLRLLAAQSCLRLGDLAAAIAEADEVTRRFPEHHGGWTLLGEACAADFTTLQGRIAAEQPRGKAAADLRELAAAAGERARQAFERATLLDPGRAGPWIGLGNLLAWQGQVDQALGPWEKALAQDPRGKIDHAWIASHVKAERRAELYEKAIHAYLASPGASPARVALPGFWLAFAHYERKRWADAAALFVKVAEADPELAGSHGYATLACYWDGRPDQAEATAARWAEGGSSAFADWVRAQKDPDECIAVLEFLARHGFDAGRLEHARDLHLVLAKVRDTARHWNNYALLCRDTERYQESWDGYVNALGLEPDSPQLLNDAAVILHYHLPTPENLAKARGMYERAVERARAVLADSQATREQKDLARQALSDATGNLRKLRG